MNDNASPTPTLNARLRGEQLQDRDIPKNLYIPELACSVLVGEFEGPLDLLLHLVRRNNVDILDLNLQELTEQYLSYIDMMKSLQINIAAEYLLMAATLTEYKARALSPVPKPQDEEEEQLDPRAEMIRRLTEYERYKNAAADIDTLPRMEREFFQPQAHPPAGSSVKPLPPVTVRQVFFAARSALRKMERRAVYTISNVRLSVRNFMDSTSQRLAKRRGFITFKELCDKEHGRDGVVVTIAAILEMLRLRVAEAVQTKTYGEIRVRSYNEDNE